MNRIIQQKIAFIPKDGGGILAALDKSIQVIGGIIGHGKYAALPIQHDQAAVLRQFQRELVPFPGVDFRLVLFQPFAFELLVLLDGPDINHILADDTLGNFLVGCIQRKTDVVAVGCRFTWIHHPGNPGHLIPLDHLVPLAEG